MLRKDGASGFRGGRDEAFFVCPEDDVGGVTLVDFFVIQCIYIK
jgi:hypothetical protein